VKRGALFSQFPRFGFPTRDTWEQNISDMIGSPEIHSAMSMRTFHHGNCMLAEQESNSFCENVL
jgi:hypothetical protein